ncbi:MAG: nucleoside hydrolase [Oscillibacter sp.]
MTQKVRLTTDHVAILDSTPRRENRPIVDYLKQALPFYFRFNRLQNNCLDHCPVHDPLAMLAAVDPSVVTVRTIPARVECGGSFCRGMVVADLREHPIEAPRRLHLRGCGQPPGPGRAAHHLYGMRRRRTCALSTSGP